MQNLYISLQNKFHFDIFIFGLPLTYLKKYFKYIFLIPDTINAFGKQLFLYKIEFPITLILCFPPLNEFLVSKNAHKVLDF